MLNKSVVRILLTPMQQIRLQNIIANDACRQVTADRFLTSGLSWSLCLKPTLHSCCRFVKSQKICAQTNVIFCVCCVYLFLTPIQNLTVSQFCVNIDNLFLHVCFSKQKSIAKK